MRPNGKKSENKVILNEEEQKMEAEAAEAFYQMFVASVEEMMADRREGGHQVHAGFQMGYFVLYANMFRDMGLYPDEMKKRIMKIYTNIVCEVIPRITAVDTLNHFEELYTTIVSDNKEGEDLISSQKRYIIAMEIELRGEEGMNPEEVGDCLMIASNHIAQTMEMFAQGAED